MRRYTETPFSIINLLLDLARTLLSVRFLLVLLGAPPENAVVKFFTEISQPLAEPFRDAFPTTVVSGFAIEWYTMAAIVTYTLATIVLLRILSLLMQIVDDDEARMSIRHHRHRHTRRHA